MLITNHQTVAVANDCCIFRIGITSIINSIEGYSVIFDANDGISLLHKIAHSHTLPDICIIDFDMPLLNGFDTTTKLSQTWPSIKSIITLDYNSKFSIAKAIIYGAKSIITKNCDKEKVGKILNNVTTKGIYFEDYFPSHVLGYLKRNNNKSYSLSEREIEFLQYCSTDMSYEKISQAMGVSCRTIDGYRNGLFEKANVKTRSGLVAFGIYNGFIPHLSQAYH